MLNLHTVGSRGTITGPPRTLPRAKLILNGRPSITCRIKHTTPGHLFDDFMDSLF
jgi:hypothetical protein